MQANQEITKESNLEVRDEMKYMHDKYRKRQGQTAINFGAKQQNTLRQNHFSSYDETKHPAGVYIAKVQVPRKSMASHLSSQYSTVNTSRERVKTANKNQGFGNTPQVANFTEYDSVIQKLVNVNSPRLANNRMNSPVRQNNAA
jgi:hypothetical protein